MVSNRYIEQKERVITRIVYVILNALAWFVNGSSSVLHRDFM